MPVDRRTQLLEAAEERDFVIVEDDYEFEISYLAPPSPALKALDPTGRVSTSAASQNPCFPGFGSAISWRLHPSFARRARFAR
ncbi:hypothetical protein D9M72_548120 [compost metagenome]